jgi:hypothetical protein
VNGSEPGHRPVGECLHCIWVPDIGYYGLDVRPGGTQSLRFLFEPFTVDVGEDQMDTFVCQRPGDSEADPTRRTSDHSHSTSKHLHGDNLSAGFNCWQSGYLQPATMWVVK